ncbi:ITGA9 (predicted), partial [Pycnogonum litorale]
ILELKRRNSTAKSIAMQKQRFNTTKTLILSILLWISSIRLLRVNCLNVDTKFPLFYHHNQKGSHFGYTVTFHRNRTSMWAMVAAPKANSTSLPSSVIESGSVYKCDLSLSSNSCQEVIFETTGNDLTLRARNSAFSYTDMKNHMWLGVSMDSGHGNFMACAHLWKNKIHKKLYLSNGLCYVINENLEKRSTMRLIPLVDRNEQAVNNVYKYAFGLAGMSSTFTDTGLLLGAPGISNYIGSNVFYEIDDPSQPYRITESYVPDVLFDTVNINSYFGYSVASGKFYNDRLTYHVSGAPKEGEIGRVFIYESLDYNKRSML